METRYILWTGGWDSTYRMIELSKKDVTVQPVYILDEKRASREYELRAIKKMTEMLRAREETKAMINDAEIIRVADIPADESIEKNAGMLKEKYGWGIQHNWTARVAKLYPMIEMCIEKVVKGYMPTRKIIADHGKLVETQYGWIVDRDNSDDVLVSVLGNITLPIFEITEEQMRVNVKEWGYEDVMSNIWFCHRPINGKPCGICSPCHTKMDSKMEFLLPETAQKRFKRERWIEEKLGSVPVKVYRRMVRLISK